MVKRCMCDTKQIARDRRNAQHLKEIVAEREGKHRPEGGRILIEFQIINFSLLRELNLGP